MITTEVWFAFVRLQVRNKHKPLSGDRTGVHYNSCCIVGNVATSVSTLL